MARRVILLGILLAMAVVSLNLGKCLSIYLCAIICVLFCYKVRSNGEKNTKNLLVVLKRSRNYYQRLLHNRMKHVCKNTLGA